MSGATRVFVGAEHTCALTDEGLSCWGNNEAAQIDDSGLARRDPTPVAFDLSGVPEPISSVGLGDQQTCVANAIGHVYCRGVDAHGELAQGTQIAPLGSARNRLFTATSPMIVEDGLVYLIDDWQEPASLSAFGKDNEVVHVGAPSCSIKRDGSLWCNAYTFDQTAELERKQQLGEKALWVGSGDFFVCALTDSCRVWCDGWNPFGQLGRGVNGGSPFLPDDWVVGLEGVRVLAVGRFSSCALTADGRVSCWGSYARAETLAPRIVSGCEGQAVAPAERIATP